MIPITVVDVADAEPLVLETLRSGMIASGPMVERLERGFARAAGTEHAVAVNSGTTALVASLQVLDLEPGDEVITSPFTFVATLNAILEAGATARFADITADDFCLDPEAVSTAIGPRTKVLMPVHLYGQMADMGKLMPFAEQYGLAVIEDAAQAVGAALDGRPAGSYGLGCFSLYATKNITTAEGGVITTDDAELADRLRILRNQGMRSRYQYELAGHNYRMTDLHAAVGIPQLERLTEINAARARNAGALSAGLSDVPALRLPQALPGRHHVWHQYTVLVDNQAPCDRDELAARLAEAGVGSSVYYPKLCFDYNCYRGHPRVIRGETPVAQRITSQVLSLPVHPQLTEADIDAIVTAVRKALGA